MKISHEACMSKPKESNGLAEACWWVAVVVAMAATAGAMTGFEEVPRDEAPLMCEAP